MPGTVLLKLKMKPQSFFSSNGRRLEEAGCEMDSVDEACCMDAVADMVLAPPELPVAVAPMLLLALDVVVVAAAPGAAADDGIDGRPTGGAPPVTVLTARPTGGRSTPPAAAGAEPTPPAPAPPAAMGRPIFRRGARLIDRLRPGSLTVLCDGPCKVVWSAIFVKPAELLLPIRPFQARPDRQREPKTTRLVA